MKNKVIKSLFWWSNAYSWCRSYKINLDDANFDEDDPGTIFHVRHMTWCNRFKQHITFKKVISQEVMPVAWYATRQ